MEEFQEADVLWPWPDTPPSPGSPDPELYERDATVAGFSCGPFSEPAVASSLSSSSTSSALRFDRSSGSSEDGFLLSGRSTVVSGLDAPSEEFLEKDVLWPDTADDDDAAEFCCRRVEEAAAAAACGKLEGWRRSVSSPIDIPVARGHQSCYRRVSPPLAVGCAVASSSSVTRSLS